MPNVVDTPPEVLTILTIGGIVIGALFFIIDARVRRMMSELKPNGGSSMRDAINRIESRQQAISLEVDTIHHKLEDQQDRLFQSIGKVHGRIDDHINLHLEGK